MMAFLSKTCVSFGRHVVERKYHVMALELAGAVAIWRGIADWSFPASLIVAGLAVISVIEIRKMQGTKT